MKRIISVILVVLMLVTMLPLSVFAENTSGIVTSGKCGDNLTWTLYNDGELVIDGIGKMDDFESGNPPWYSYKNYIKNLTIANGVTSIGNTAFWNCSNLENITISNSVTLIGNRAFSDCVQLTNITIPSSVTNIGILAFSNCDNLASITVNENNKNYSSDKNGVLFNKDKTELIQYPIGNTSTEYTIPTSVTFIGNCSFEDCKNLIKINIPDSVTSIGFYAFFDCHNLTNITIPDSATAIGYAALTYCDNITSITVDKNNNHFSNDAYGVLFNKNKTELIQYPIGNTRKEYSIPDNVVSINTEAFFNCKNITRITIPDSVTNIGTLAFDDCDNLASITVNEHNKNYSSDKNGVLFNKNKTELIQYPIGNARTKYAIPVSVTSIGEEAFSDCKSLTSITISDSVTSIGEEAFSDCESLTSITISDSVTSIGEYAFNKCNNLNTVYYTGTEDQWNNINIDQGNEDLTNADIIFNFTGNSDNTLVMATSANFPPFEYVENGNYVGIDIEIAEKIAEKLGMALEIRDVEFSSIISGVQSGKFDMGIAGMIITETRLNYVNFSNTYAANIQVVIVTEDSPITSLDDLKGDGSMKFGVQKNTTSDIYVSEDVENGGYGEENVVRYNTGAEAIQALKSGTVDAVIINSESAKSFVSADNTIRILDEEYCVENYAIAIAKENHELLTAVNNALAELKSDGTIDRILSKYSLPNQNAPERPYDGIDIKIYSSLPNLNVGKDQEIRFAVSLFEEGTQIESKNGYSVIIKDNAYIELTETYKSGKEQIFVFEGKKEGNTKVSFIENDTKIQKDLTIYVSNDCRYFRCESLNQPGARQIGSIYITDFSCSQNNDGTQNIKFNAYNTNYSYATAEVFDQNGTFLKSVALAPKTDGSGMEKVINSFKYVYIDITDHTTPWYKKEANSQHTYVDIGNLPENSTIRITSDGKKSNIVTLYTGIDLFVNIVMLASGIAINKDAQKASVNELVKNIVENMPENAIKALASELSTEMLNGSTKEAAENTYNIIFNIFSDIGISYKKILTEVLTKMGYGALDSIVTTLVPSWKIVTAVDDITAIGWELLSYSSFEYGSGEIKIYIANHGLENMLIENGISVSQNELFSKTTILDAYVVEDSDELKNVYCGAISGVVYNITLRDQGKEIQPNGSIDVRIPIPKDIVGTKCAVYRLETDGTKTEMLTRLDDGYLVFTTDHLSYYEVVSTKHDETNHTPGEWQVTTPAQVGVDGLEQLRCTVCGKILDERVIPALSDPITFTPGDLNGDGKITASDARAALRISAKLDTPTEEQFMTADVNGDEKITASDARIILRVSAKLQTF
ncbi:MAG: leucine-rich repeat protein [Clostridia bacterium]|nr:leucine-rich repeat protein [Clostridia bacterium]